MRGLGLLLHSAASGVSSRWKHFDGDLLHQEAQPNESYRGWAERNLRLAAEEYRKSRQRNNSARSGTTLSG